MDAKVRISRLVEWATSHGASLHPSVEVYEDDQTGFSFRVKLGPDFQGVRLAPWEPIVTLPTSLTLSYVNAVASSSHSMSASTSSSPDPFNEDFVAKTPPHVVGRMFLVWQYLLGKESFWWPYIQVLPQPDDDQSWQLAPFWPPDDAELLEGTNVEVGLDKIRRDVRNEYSRATELLALHDDNGVLRSVTMKLYQWAYCIFSSRSFRPSLVLSDEERGHLAFGVSMDDFSVLLPLFDIGNHDMTADVRWDLKKQPNLEGGDNTVQSSCVLSIGQEFKPGQQIFNNYSMKTNAELLLGYGFMIPATEELHNDYTHVRKRTSSPTASEEYYISYRPMAHPSSLLGRYRQELVVSMPPGKTMLGQFRHVQPDMVWDIFNTLLRGRGENLSDVIPLPSASAADEVTRQQKFFAGDVGDECQPYVEQTSAIIQHKVLQELERLDETEVEVAEGDEEALTANQKLALEYRRRCRLVLENTLDAMGDDGEL